MLDKEKLVGCGWFWGRITGTTEGTHSSTASPAVPISIFIRHRDPLLEKNRSKSAADGNMISDLKSFSLQNQSHVIQNSEFLTNFPDRFSQLLSLLAGLSFFHVYHPIPKYNPFLPRVVANIWIFLITLLLLLILETQQVSIFFFFFGHGSWLMESQFPDQGLNPGRGSESLEYWSLGHQGILEQVHVWTEDCDGRCPKCPLPKFPLRDVCICV